MDNRDMKSKGIELSVAHANGGSDYRAARFNPPMSKALDVKQAYARGFLAAFIADKESRL
jgi:hypothetical protein